MPIFEYKCLDCNVLIERIFPSLEKSTDSVKCVKCNQQIPRCDVPSSISLSRSTMDNSPIDNIIGKDSDARWQDISDRQNKRDSVRSKSGTIGLSEQSRNEFIPVSRENIETRENVFSVRKDDAKIEAGSEATNTWLSKVKD